MPKNRSGSNGTCECPAGALEPGRGDDEHECRQCGRGWLLEHPSPGGAVALAPLPSRCPACGIEEPLGSDEDNGGTVEEECRACGETLRFYVNEYFERLEYGGPEEGGWWFETGEYAGCHGCHGTREEAEARVQALAAYLARAQEGQYDPQDVRSTGQTRLRVQGRRGETFPEARPRYE